MPRWQVEARTAGEETARLRRDRAHAREQPVAHADVARSLHSVSQAAAAAPQSVPKPAKNLGRIGVGRRHAVWHHLAVGLDHRSARTASICSRIKSPTRSSPVNSNNTADWPPC